MANNGAEHPDKIDLVTEHDDYVNLIIVQTAALTDDLLLSLQDKLNNYLSFALDGHLHEIYPSTKYKKIVVTVDLYDYANSSIFDFLNKSRDVFAKSGVTLKWGEQQL